MEVIALVGPSGTGKSHRALKIAFDSNSDLIIDDGLLIQGSQIIEGISAKKQTTKIGAIKTALFTDSGQRDQAQKTISLRKPERILVLGTSWEMVVKILERLNLPLPVQRINIEQIASSREIQKALYYRNKMGKHVIPAPTVEVKRNFPNTLIDSFRIILDRQDSGQHMVAEQSVLRPTYSSLGHFTVAEKVLADISRKIVNDLPGIAQAGRIKIASGQGSAIIDVQYTAKYGYKLHRLSRQIQINVKEGVERFTGLDVTAVNTLVTNLVLPATQTFENITPSN